MPRTNSRNIHRERGDTLPLNPKQEAFSQLLADGLGVNEAYVKAGYGTSGKHGSRLRNTPQIVNRVNEILAERAEIRAKGTERAIEEVGLTEAYIIQGLMENAERCLGRRQVKDINGKMVWRFAPTAANQALELLGKTKAMFIERAEVGKPGDFSDLSTEQLRERAEQMMRELRIVEHVPKKAAKG